MRDVKNMFDDVLDEDFAFEFHPTGQKTKIVDYSLLKPSNKNRRIVLIRVENLVESIKLHGKLLEDIIATDNRDGSYTLLSGHHRLSAIKHLVEKEGLSEFSKIRIKIEEENELDNELILIDCNLEREELSPYDKVIAFGRKEVLLIEKKKRNEIHYKGSTRSYIADSNALKATQVGVYLRIYKKGGKCVKKALQENKINITQAYDICALSEEEQQKKLQELLHPPQKNKSKEEPQNELLNNLRKRIQEKVSTKVNLNKNTLAFKYCTPGELATLLDILHLDVEESTGD